jgi:PAS domain-containing protein
MTFFERSAVGSQDGPIWICTSPQCGYRTAVREPSELIPAEREPNSRVRAKGRKQQSADLHARARRAVMRSRARIARAERLINTASKVRKPWVQEIWIETDDAGRVTGSSPAAVLLTGYSPRSLQGRELPILFIKDRPGPTQLRHVMLGHPVERESWIRPRERRAVHVRYRIELIQANGLNPTLRWTLERIG